MFQVYLSHRKSRLETYLPNNLEQKPGIAKVTKQTVVFENGDEVAVDVIMFSTGYQYRFPFLSPDCHVMVTDERIVPLYKHIIHTEHPSLSLVGILKTICPFPNFHNQVLFAMAALDGSMKLPSSEEMTDDTKEDFQKRMSQGMPKRYAHTMGPLQWRYNDEIADLAGFERIPVVVEELYDNVHLTRVKDIVHYKRMNYELTGPRTYRAIPDDNS